VFAVYMLYQFYRTWLQLAAEQSIDASAGFMMGLIYMAALFFVIKSAGFLYDEVSEYIGVWKTKRRENIPEHDSAADD
jgi:type III secretory pathway component EscT